MTIHILVEGSSERTLLDKWIPRLRLGHDVRVHPHQGKGELPEILDQIPDPKRRGLLDQLPAKLRGFQSSAVNGSDMVLILVDADDQCPTALETSLREIVSSQCPSLIVSVCIAVEETEAFYLGDLAAIRRAFPGADMEKARTYVPDSICGTWEFFAEVVGDDGGRKVAWAEAMGSCLTTRPERSRSPSFRRFVRGLAGLLLPRPVAGSSASKRVKATTKRRRARR